MKHLPLVLAALLLTAPLWARGTQEKDFEQTQGKGNFTQSIDLTKKTPGEYNLLVRTTDAAGNTAYAGPFNFYYDPASDNPLMTIANPAPGSRQGGNFRAVGVASAPKGVAQVEVKLDAGEWVPAQGKAFWSAAVDTTALSDGVHQLSVRGTDVNGLLGPVATVSFPLDQKTPTVVLTSHQSGDRVHGTVTLVGAADDGNGLGLLEVSTDGRKTWMPVGLQGDGSAAHRPFSLNLETARFADGPLVVAFRVTDGQHSEGRQAVLLYVDNTLPAVTVLSPPAGKGLHGRVRFALSAEQTLGLKSLSARVGADGKPTDIPVVPGNPFHVVDLDLPAAGTGTLPVIFEAVDTSGKTGRATYQAVLDGGVDLPVFTLASDWTKAPVAAPLRLVGTLAATDGPGALAWSLNGAVEVVQPVGAAFDFPLPGLVTGTNRLTLVPIDALGKRGKAVASTFTVVLGAPVVRWDAVVQNDQEVPFRPGMPVSPDKKVRLKGTLTLANPLKTAVWTLGAGKEQPAAVSGSGTNLTFVLSLPEDPPFGTVPVTLKVTDAFGQTTTAQTFLDIANLARAQGPEGLVFVDPRVGTPSMVITPEAPLQGVFIGGAVKTVELLTGSGTVPLSVLVPSVDGSTVTVKALKDGKFSAVRLRAVTDKGRVYEADLGTVQGDTSPPAIVLSSPVHGAWVKENLRIDGTVTDNNGIAKLEWTIDNGQHWQSLDPPSGLGGPFTRQLSLPGPDDAVNLLIRATDGSGRTGTVLTVVRRDTAPPSVELTLPTVPSGTKGVVYAVGRLRDDGALQKAEVTLNKKTSTLPLDRPFLLAIDAAGASGTVHAIDWAGNVTDQGFTLAPSDESATTAKPEVRILFPAADAKGLSGVVPVVGRVVGFSQAPTVTVKTDGGDKALELTDAGFFTFETDLDTPKGRGLSFTAVGAAKESATLSFNLPSDPAAALPSARFLTQGGRPILIGNVTATGWIGDQRGTVTWVAQLDAGEKKTIVPDPAKGPVGTFLVDLGVPSVGPHKLSVTPVNAAGRSGTPAVTEFVSTVASGPVEFTSFVPGALVSGKDARLQGKIPSVNTWRKTEVRFADLSQPDPWNGPFQSLPVSKGSDGVWTFDLPIPNNLPYARIGVLVRGEDSLGQSVEGRTLFHRVWPKDSSQIQDGEGFAFADDRLDASGRFTTVPGSPLTGLFRGRPVKTFALTPAQGSLNATLENGVVSIDAKAEGLSGPFTVTAVTVDNEKFTAGPFTLYADAGGPTLTWDAPANGLFLKDTVSLTGQVVDPSGLAALELSLDGTSWTAIPVKDGRFETTVPVPGADGLVRLQLRAIDKGGHVSVDSRALIKDGAAPTWTLVAPPADRKVNGRTTLIGSATDYNPIASIEYSDDKKTFHPADGTATFAFDVDFAAYEKLPESFWIRTTDASGNQAVTPLVVPLNQEADRPVVQIQSPAEGEVVRSDFFLSGMAFDDDGIQSLTWRLDGGPWQTLEGAESFQVPITLSSLTDNDHFVEVQATDIWGTKGNVYRSAFKVSLAPPEALLQTPAIDTTVSGIVGLVGASFDRNGVQGVQISLDNGLTWNRADLRPHETFLATDTPEAAKGYLTSQRTEWEWRFDSRTLKDGTYLVMVRTSDGYGTVGLYTSLVNLDNQAPSLTLTTPLDAAPVLEVLDLEGRSADNIQLISLTAELRPIPSGTTSAKAVVGSAVLTATLPVTPTFVHHWNLGALAPGWYNLRLEARDAAGNATYVARNVRVEGASADRVELLFPQAGESLHGAFFVEGKVTSRTAVDKAVVTIDGKTKIVVAVDPHGSFSTLLDASVLSTGDHKLDVSVQQSATTTLVSEPRPLVFDAEGPWIKVSSHKSGAYVTQRPFLSGQAGWSVPPPAADAAPEVVQAYRKFLEDHRVTGVEVSLDNGKTFSPAQGTTDWKFRLESLGIPDGPQPLVFRARFQDGSAAIQRLLVTVDQTPPEVALLTNLENGRFNGTLDIAGYTGGNGEVQAVEVAVRQGDKSGYQVPQFIQGMYLDAHFLGATLWESGLGLTFFQDAVKLQAQVGQTPEYLPSGATNRFYGTVVGAKLIASIAQLPAAYFLGPDWSWLSTSFGLGANFAEFSMTSAFFDFSSSSAVMLGGVVFQWETIKAQLKDMVFFRSSSWYNEVTVWFISSDVQAEAVWTYSTGLRIGLF